MYLYSTRRTPRHRTVHNANSRYATDHHAPMKILYDIVSCAVCAHTSCNFVSLSTNNANSNRRTHSEYPKKNLRSHSLDRLRHCVHRLVEMFGVDPLLQTLELSQPEICFWSLFNRKSSVHAFSFTTPCLSISCPSPSRLARCPLLPTSAMCWPPSSKSGLTSGVRMCLNSLSPRTQRLDRWRASS